jgi:hypothetical protein
MRPASIANYRETVTRQQNSALARLETRGSLVDDINATLAANQAVVAVTGFQRLERIFDLHDTYRSRLAGHSPTKTRPMARENVSGALENRDLPVNHKHEISSFWRNPRKMPHLATGTWLGLTVEMKQQTRLRGQLSDLQYIRSDQVFHSAV